MRQTTATWTILLAVVIVVAAAGVFGLARGWWWAGGHHGEAGHDEHGGHAHGEGPQGGGSGSAPSGGPSGEVIDGVRVVEVKARQFEFDPGRIVVRQGETVRLNATSEDVTHGIGIATFGVDRKLPPGETQAIEFTADQPGRHPVHCTVYCGEGHNDMTGTLIVLAEE